ncbi:MAG: DUF2723 domain-containing protein [Candidatus Eisenbacteria bacterium]|uniref:DUF2723 domain-containing protein n=1 Tax=Eiseniibacteriota bacterium TaxID=2212470 RepID=A0A538SQG6_UNCEI|nr:MAG: DUF2723 domain-containing protein [Candidatus Eisenbacteria bacterium]
MHRSVRGAAWVAALAALWAYALTLSPTVAWVNLGEDSGDLLVASATLGIPHPTGYPLFVLLGRVASLLPLGAIAFRINLIAAIAGAASVYFLVRLAYSLTPPESRGLGALLSAGACALLYASSRGAWSQSVLAEVYTLNAAFLGAILWLLVKAEEKRDVRFLLLASYLFGLGLTNHLLLLAASPALLVGIWRFSRTNRIGLWTAVLLPLLAFWGLTLDLFLPVRAAQDPEFSWGTPVTPERLWWVLSGAQYGRNFFARGLPGILNHLVPGRWGVDFGWGLVLLGTGLLLALIRRDGRAASGWAAFLASLVLLSVYAIGDDVGYWMPAAWIAAALAGSGWASLWNAPRWRPVELETGRCVRGPHTLPLRPAQPFGRGTERARRERVRRPHVRALVLQGDRLQEEPPRSRRGVQISAGLAVVPAPPGPVLSHPCCSRLSWGSGCHDESSDRAQYPQAARLPHA